MAPEAYIGFALYDGIARNLPKTVLRENVAEAYRIYQRLASKPVSLLVNEWPEMERYRADVPVGRCAVSLESDRQ